MTTDWGRRSWTTSLTSHGSGGFGWNMFLFAVAVAMIAVNWGFLRPASRQLAQMQQHIDALERNIQQLTRAARIGGAGGRPAAVCLAEQGRQSEQAAAGLAADPAIAQQRLLDEADQLQAATAASIGSRSLRQDVAASAGLIEQTRAALSSTSDLQQQLISDGRRERRMPKRPWSGWPICAVRLLRSVGYLEEARAAGG